MKLSMNTIKRKGWSLKNIRSFSRIILFLLFMLPLFRFELAKAYDDLIIVYSSPNLYIPDGEGAGECGDWVEDIIHTNLPEEAIVLSVDVSFTVSHDYPSDLVVELQYDDTTFSEILWNMDGQSSTYTKNGIWSFYGLKANTYWKLRLKDCFIFDVGTLVSWTLTVHYHIPPDPPALVWASTGSGQREIDVGWFKVYDPQCQQYWIEWNRKRDTLLFYDVAEGGVYARSCDSTSKTINGLRCVEQYFFRVKSVSIYGAYIMGKPSTISNGALSSYCQNVVVSGSLEYVNYDDQQTGYTNDADTIPLSGIPITIWSASGDSFAVPPIYTGNFGLFITTLASVTEPIYMRFKLINQDESFAVFGYSDKSIIYTFSDTKGPDSDFEVVKDQAWKPDTIFAKASYSYDYLQRTKDCFQSLPPAPWDTPPVQVWYDYNNFTDIASSEYDILLQRYVIYLTSNIKPFMYRMGTPVHEYAHIIHMKAWDITSPFGCPVIHSPDTPTSGYCALVEGWAEFLSCVIDGDKAKYLEHNNRDLESNEWWAGLDGKNVDGSIVEGAVASAWYDMEDENIDNPDECNDIEYYELGYELGNIFDIFKSSKPQNMIEFMNYWQSYPGLENWEKEHLIRIFAQHHIVLPVSGDVNCDGKVSLSDIVYLINYLFKSGPGFEPFWKGDTNGNCKVSLSDIVWLINYLFKSGPAPVCSDSCWSCS